MIKNQNRIKILRKIIVISLVGLLLVFIGASITIHLKKDAIISKVIQYANKGYKGKIIIGKTNISPFENFPYISIRLKDLKVYETKTIDSLAIIDVKDAYIGLDFWRMVNNN